MYIVDYDSFEFNGITISDGPGLALLDTGNTLISIPTRYKDAILKSLKQNKGLKCTPITEANENYSQVQCEGTAEHMPDFGVTLQGIHFKVLGKDIIDQCTSLFGLFFRKCMINIEFENDGYQIILGKLFVSALSYSVFRKGVYDEYVYYVLFGQGRDLGDPAES